MDEVSVGKLLPNIKVTLGSDDEGEYFSNSSDSAMDDCSNSNEVFPRPEIQSFNNPKSYINKDGGFSTGIDLIQEEKSGILSKRAERFGLDIRERPSISSLYKSMGIDITKKDSAKTRKLRLDTIHVRGVDELDTSAVLKYFQTYCPERLEWINDSSCNVIFNDEYGCARALLGLSKSLPTISTSAQQTEKSGVEQLNDEELLVMETDPSAVDVPCPPGIWRLGVPVPEDPNRTLLMRFATKDDKKVPGAEKRSNYYKKYGNPNYGGLTGLITSSRKRKVQAESNRWAVEKKSKSLSKYVPDIPQSRTKPLRMRMYADDEELKAKKRRSRDYIENRKPNVRSRLGVKYTFEDLCQLGPCDNNSYDDEPVDFKPRNSSVDLRSKIKKRKNYRKTLASSVIAVPEKSSSIRSYDQYDPKKYQNMDESKPKKSSVFKRKYRSPLCQGEDGDEDEDEYSSDE